MYVHRNFHTSTSTSSLTNFRSGKLQECLGRQKIPRRIPRGVSLPPKICLLHEMALSFRGSEVFDKMSNRSGFRNYWRRRGCGEAPFRPFFEMLLVKREVKEGRFRAGLGLLVPVALPIIKGAHVFGEEDPCLCDTKGVFFIRDFFIERFDGKRFGRFRRLHALLLGRTIGDVSALAFGICRGSGHGAMSHSEIEGRRIGWPFGEKVRRIYTL
jgi:hypothetical protein